MANLTKTKTLFGFTSPRTLEKIIPEIDILVNNFSNLQWSGNTDLQIDFFDKLFKSAFYAGESYPSQPDLAARDRITRAPKALGFVDLKPTIKITEIGKKLLQEKRLDEIFTRQLLKFQLPSPYHIQSQNIEFKVKPYLELIRLIHDLGSLSKTEIALFFLQLTNIDKYEEIKNKIIYFRENSKNFHGSRKMYVAKCFEQEIIQIFNDEVESQRIKTRESKDISLKKFISTKQANLKDYADAFSRYIRATELITFERRTFRLIISPAKQEEVNYLLSEIERTPRIFESEKDFKEYLFTENTLTLFSDNKDLLVSKIHALDSMADITNKTLDELKDKLDEYKHKIKNKNIEERKNELKSYREKQEISEIIQTFDQIVKKEVPDPPLFLEWNVWRSLVMLNYAKKVDGNFIMDIDGMPLNYAPGNKPDIEVEYDDFGIIVEVTMSSGNTQYNMESESVPRHYGKAKEKFDGKDMYCIFIAPKISEGALAHFFNLNRINTKLYGGQTKIIPLSLNAFTSFIETGIKNQFKNPQILKAWLESQWENNQNSDDENIWHEQVNSSINSWV
jgi:hypothetical protein